MSQRFTLGIEEEFQMVNRDTGQLVSHIHKVLEKGRSLLGEQIKAEMLQSTVELISGICPTISDARQELAFLRSTLAGLIEEDGLALISAGTHPSAHWSNETRTQHERYEELEQEYQDVARSVLIFGMHIHVGLETRELAIPLMNQLRMYIPYLVALSSNSPFWAGRYSGLKSYRTIVWKRFPRSGLPELFSSTAEFEQYVARLIETGCIDDGKRIWWDIRPHPYFNTIEFRCCDMPATFEDTLALAALCQALVAKLCWHYKRNMQLYALSNRYVEENKWLAARYGLDAELVDFVQKRRLTMREAIEELLDFVDDVVDDLGSRREMQYLRTLLADSRGTGADRQIAVYEETGSVHAVAQYLIAQATQGVSLPTAR